jgi:N-acetylmuramoyl-L-alanine amidase
MPPIIVNAAGIETYYLNLAKTEKVAQLAAKENGTSLEKVSTLQAILFDLMANYKLNDSAHLAEEVQKALYKTAKANTLTPKTWGSSRDLSMFWWVPACPVS